MKHIDEHYRDWYGNDKCYSDCRPVHDSSACIDFAEHYYDETKRDTILSFVNTLSSQDIELIKMGELNTVVDEYLGIDLGIDEIFRGMNKYYYLTSFEIRGNKEINGYVGFISAGQLPTEMKIFSEIVNKYGIIKNQEYKKETLAWRSEDYSLLIKNTQAVSEEYYNKRKEDKYKFKMLFEILNPKI